MAERGGRGFNPDAGPQQRKRDYYVVLGIPREASPVDIKKAFRTLAMKYHPDRNPGDKDAEARFKEVAEAYEALWDDEKRAQYDRFGHGGAPAASRGTAGPDTDPFDFGDFGFGKRSAGGGRAGTSGPFAGNPEWEEFVRRAREEAEAEDRLPLTRENAILMMLKYFGYPASFDHHQQRYPETMWREALRSPEVKASLKKKIFESISDASRLKNLKDHVSIVLPDLWREIESSSELKTAVLKELLPVLSQSYFSEKIKTGILTIFSEKLWAAVIASPEVRTQVKKEVLESFSLGAYFLEKKKTEFSKIIPSEMWDEAINSPEVASLLKKKVLEAIMNTSSGYFIKRVRDEFKKVLPARLWDEAICSPEVVAKLDKQIAETFSSGEYFVGKIYEDLRDAIPSAVWLAAVSSPESRAKAVKALERHPKLRTLPTSTVPSEIWDGKPFSVKLPNQKVPSPEPARQAPPAPEPRRESPPAPKAAPAKEVKEAQPDLNERLTDFVVAAMDEGRDITVGDILFTLDLPPAEANGVYAFLKELGDVLEQVPGKPGNFRAKPE